MITNFFIPELNNHDVQELWFQQDGATCHTARATIDLLKDTFGYVKSLVYADKPQTFDHLEDNIRRVIADIRPQMLEKVIENWTSRLDYIRASRGSHMPEIIFKMTREAERADFCGLPMRRDEERGVDPPWCLKRFFFMRRQESPGWRELEESPEKKGTWTVEDRDWSGKRGETPNAGGVGERVTKNAGGVGGLESMV
ncbi:hypothetical protein TNCV_3971091 [Trichonephila clavipes]|nr:hypothetical protein TNCV_3971091 [Trichonephila clavipes]